MRRLPTNCYSIKALMIRLHRAEAGSIAIMSALVMTMLLGFTALAVDVAALYTERRSAQGVVDLAAIAGASDIRRADAAVAATLRANNLSGALATTVEAGRYVAEPTLSPADRFKSGAEPMNAVRVTLAKPSRTYFAKVFNLDKPTIRVQGLAINTALAHFSVGSRLAALREGVINNLLSRLFGSNISLSAMDYDALLNADIQVVPFINSLATQLNLTAGTYSDVLNSSASVGDIIAAMANVTGGDGDQGAQAALSALLSQLGSATATLPLTTLLDLGPLGTASIGDSIPGLDASYRASELINAVAVLSNGTNQAVVDLDLAVPGLIGLRVEIAIGEPPQGSAWSAVGEAGTRVRTAQTRLKLLATIGGTGILSGVGVQLPIYLQVAHAEAKLEDIGCLEDGVDSVTVSARPGIAEAWIGELSGNLSNFDFSPSLQPAKIVNAAIARIEGAAHVLIGDTTSADLRFSKADIENATLKRVGTTNLLESLVSSLVHDLTLDVKVLGLDLGLGSMLSGLVRSLLSDVARPLDAIVSSLLTTLGVRVGEADVRVHGAMCRGSRLAG